ncbi:MAG: putative Ig domain-containing protein, partial [Steroidobacteraceae bacterium]
LCLALYFCQTAVVAAPNRAPSISGSPVTTAYVGMVYSFQPTASDPDGNKLTFKISMKPAWATFGSTTGMLTGTPSSSQTGTYSNIVISVTDGRVTKALPAFAINVTQAMATTTPVTLSWVPPTQNVDGTTLTNLTGYKVFYGKASGQYPYSVSIGSPSITSAVIENLAPATWYFAIKAITASGTQSDFSTQLSKTVL